MKTGLDYEKLMELLSCEVSKDRSEPYAEGQSFGAEREGTYVERITLKLNGEVQISTWERLPCEIRRCERYTYAPNKSELKYLLKLYGPLKLGESKTIKRVYFDGHWVKV